MGNTDTIAGVWPADLLVTSSYSSISITSISKISSICRPLAIVVDTIAIRSMVVRAALLDIRAGTTIVSSISRPLAITITSVSIRTIPSKPLWASVGVASGIAAIAWLSISRPLAITNVVTIGVRLWVVSISMVSL